jgi:transcriptional regulator with XRE-family HTH domain
MAARAEKFRLRDARLQLGLSQAEVGERLNVSGTAIGHYETGVSKPSPDRAAHLAKLLGLKSGDVVVSERGSVKMTPSRPRSTDARRGAGRVRDAMVPSQDEATVLTALRAMPAAERLVVTKLILAYGRTGSRAVARRRR